MFAKISASGVVASDARTFDAGGSQAVSFGFSVKTGYGEREAWLNTRVAVFGKSAEFAAKLRKGDALTVVGSLSERSYDKDGAVMKVLEIKADIVDRPVGSTTGQSQPQSQPQTQPQGNPAQGRPPQGPANGGYQNGGQQTPPNGGYQNGGNRAPQQQRAQQQAPPPTNYGEYAGGFPTDDIPF
jgi:single-stranded DNA-binding protein